MLQLETDVVNFRKKSSNCKYLILWVNAGVNIYPSCNSLFNPSSRTRVLLLNAFSLAEDSITLDNVFEWIEKLNTTYPQQFAELANKLENCDLESELDTVCSSSLPSSYSDVQ